MSVKTNFVERTSFNIYLNAFTGLLGVATGKLIRSPWAVKGLFYFAIFSDLFVAVFYLSNSLRLVSPNVPLAERCINFLSNNTYLQSIAKFTYLLSRRKKFQRFCETWDKSFLNAPFEDHAEKLHAVERRKVKQLTVCLLLMFVLTAVPWCFLPLFRVLQDIHGGRFLNIPLWLPLIDVFQSPTYEVVLTLTSISAWFTITKNIAYDGFFFSLVSLQIVQLQHLKFTIGKIFDGSHEMTDWNPSIQGASGGGDLVSVSITCSDAPAMYQLLKKGGKASNSMSTDNLSKLKLKTETRKNFALWVQHHQQAMKLGELLYDLYSPMIIAQFVTTTLILCFTAFTITSVHLDVVQYVLTTVYCFGCTLQLYLLCHYGDRLADASLSIADACFASGWYRTHVKQVRSSLLIVLQRVRRPLTFSFYGLYPLSAEMFVNIMQGSISYLMILLNITQKQ